MSLIIMINVLIQQIVKCPMIRKHFYIFLAAGTLSSRRRRPRLLRLRTSTAAVTPPPPHRLGRPSGVSPGRRPPLIWRAPAATAFSQGALGATNAVWIEHNVRATAAGPGRTRTNGRRTTAQSCNSSRPASSSLPPPSVDSRASHSLCAVKPPTCVASRDRVRASVCLSVGRAHPPPPVRVRSVSDRPTHAGRPVGVAGWRHVEIPNAVRPFAAPQRNSKCRLPGRPTGGR